MSKQTALVIDDERDIRELLTITLGRMNLDVVTVGSVGEARARLAERKFDLCFTDMRLPDGSGQEIVELIARQYSETPVAMKLPPTRSGRWAVALGGSGDPVT